MKILVMSDIHSARSVAVEILSKNRVSDVISFLGDGERNFEVAMAECGLELCGNEKQRVYQVTGNCDHGSREETVLLPKLGGIKLCITHGHGHGVKSGAGINALAEYAAQQACSVALFGHTHKRFKDKISGVTMFNPGAVQNGQYGVIMIENGEIRLEHK